MHKQVQTDSSTVLIIGITLMFRERKKQIEREDAWQHIEALAAENASKLQTSIPQIRPLPITLPSLSLSKILLLFFLM